MHLLRRALFFGLPAVVVLIVVVFGIWWFAIRSDAKPATSAPDIPEELTSASVTPTAETSTVPGAATSTAPATSGQPYTIVQDESSASYFVGEKLASLSLPSTAKGTTTIEGQFGLDNDTLAPGTTFKVDLTGLKSDESRRDQRVQSALETSQYPEATFVAESLTGVPNPVPEGQEFPLQLTGKFTLHGVTKDVTWDVKAKKQGQAISALATLEITFADYNINKPDIAGFVSVDDTATIQVSIVAQAA
jgi:polyisoprenoid-binding protein YceI